MPGATAEGTAGRLGRHPAAPGHHRTWRGLTLSSLGMGSYLGETDEASCRAYEAAAVAALEGGVNVLDTAANYRDQASERDLGRALRRAGGRDGVLVCSKAGFLHGDHREEDAHGWFRREYVEGGALRDEDVVGGCHSLAPAYLRHELGRSLANLGLDHLDVWLLHNRETQIQSGVPEPEFLRRMEDAFALAEQECDAGRIGAYGVATWSGLRVAPGDPGHLSLVKLVHHAGQARRRVGGKAGDHHFAAVQLPVNLAMPEAAAQATQEWRFGRSTVLECARDVGLLVLASASLVQMRLRGRIPPDAKARLGTPDEAHAALQFARSVPGVHTALVGMGGPEHARSNAAFAAAVAPDPEAAKELLPSRR